MGICSSSWGRVHPYHSAPTPGRPLTPFLGHLSRPEKQPFTRQTRRTMLGARIADHLDRAPARFRPIVQQIAHRGGRDHIVERDAAHPQPDKHIPAESRRANLVAREPGIRHPRRAKLPAPRAGVQPLRIGLYPRRGRPLTIGDGRTNSRTHRGGRSRRCRCHEVSQSGVLVVPSKGSTPRLHGNNNGCNVANCGSQRARAAPPDRRWVASTVPRGHVVGAAQIAAIGESYAQILGDAAETREGCHEHPRPAAGDQSGLEASPTQDITFESTCSITKPEHMLQFSSE